MCVLFVGSIERALNIKYKRDTNGWYAGDAAVMNIFASIWTKNLPHTCQIFHVIYCDPNYIRHGAVLVIVDVRGGGEDLGETERLRHSFSRAGVSTCDGEGWGQSPLS